MMLHTHLSGNEGQQVAATPSTSYRQRLRDLLFEIEDMAEDTDCSPVSQGLQSILRQASHADEATAKMIFDAIHLGEDFACLYIQNFVEFPSRPHHCRRQTHPCK